MEYDDSIGTINGAFDHVAHRICSAGRAVIPSNEAHHFDLTPPDTEAIAQLRGVLV